VECLKETVDQQKFAGRNALTCRFNKKMGRKIFVYVNENGFTRTSGLHNNIYHYEWEDAYRKNAVIAIGQEKAYYQSTIDFKAN